MTDFPVQENGSGLDALIQQYMTRVGVFNIKDKGTVTGLQYLIPSAIKTHRIQYCKHTSGDCGTPTKVDLGALRSVKLAGSIAGAGATGVGIAGVAATQVAGITVGTLLGAATFGLGLIALPLSIFAHHNAAVAQETQTLCQVQGVFNQYEQQIEDGVKSGSIPLNEAIQLQNQVSSGMVQTLQSGYKDCNGYCWMQYVIKVLNLWMIEQAIPRMVPSTLQSVESTVSNYKGPLLALAGAAVVAKFLL